jgi:PAS domain S-box-containing protein
MPRKRASAVGDPQEDSVTPRERVVEQESARLTQEILDKIPAPVYAVDAAGRFLLTNKRLDVLLGTAHRQALGETRESFLPRHIAAEHRENDLKIIRCGQELVLEERNLEPDGEHVYSTIKFPLHDARGRIYAIGGISTDITERKRLEQVLCERVKELGAFFRLAEIVEREGITLERLCREFAAVLPQSWQYPEVACARIQIGGNESRTDNYAESPWRQSAPIGASGTVSGQIEVAYLEKRPDADEGPFLREERLLIDALAERLGRIAERIGAEKRLRENEDRLALVLAAAALGIYDVDLRSGDTYCSPEYAAMLGYGPDELDISPRSGTWENLLHPDDKDRVLDDLDRHLRGEAESYDGEFRLRTKAGDWRWVRSRGRVVERDVTGRALRLVGTHADINARKRAQERMEDSEARFRTLSENALTGVDIIQDGQLIYVNPAMARIFGYEPAELIGSSALKVIHPDDHALVAENMRRRVEGDVKSLQYEVRGLCKNGEERTIEVLGTAVTLNGRPAIVGNILDITDRERAKDLLRRSEQDAVRTAAQLRRVMDLNAHISEGLGLDRVMQTVHDQCAALMLVDTFYIALYDASAGVATFPFYCKDGARREIPPRDVRGSPGLVAHVIAGRKTVYLPDAPASSLQLVHQPGSLTRSIVAIPLNLHGKVIGVFSTQSTKPNAYTEEQITTLEQLAAGIAVAIENSRLYDAVSQGLEATLAALGRATESRDPYTAGHQLRVTDLALAIASKLGFTMDACHALRISGMLHDIGKLGVPAEILSKPTALSRIEFSLVQTHPRNAHEILAGIAFPGPVAEIVLQHHERLDGSGYPNGIPGDNILPGAKVLAVADVVEAIASHRPYRPALGITAALDEIRSGRGTRYDEQVVDACVALFESGAFAFDAA